MPFAHLLTPGDALILLLLGVLGLYCEFLRPGRFLPALAGLSFATVGVYAFAQMEIEWKGLWLIALALALFGAEAWRQAHFVAAVAGTALLSVGCCLLVRSPAPVSPALAIPVCGIFGLVTTVLLRQANRARRNKWSDLAG